MVRKLVLITVLTLLLAVCFAAAARADYSFDGFPLKIVHSDTINGVLYVDGGHGLMTNDASNPYVQSFQVPAGQVDWARLYVGVWGGNPDTTGTLSVSLNNAPLGTIGIGNNTPAGAADWMEGSGYGVWWAPIDVSKQLVAGATDSVSSYTYNGTSSATGGFDGRIYGVVLVAALKQANAPAMSYQVAEGNVDLNYKTPVDTYSLTFPGSFSPGAGATADLTTVLLTGNEGVANSLYCNDKLLSGNAADGGGQSLNGNQWEDRYFDLDHWDITADLAAQDNKLTFARGETTFLHPVLVVLRSLPKSEAQALLPTPAATGQTASGQAPAQVQDAFTDIANSSARVAINKLAAAGIVSGFDDHTFHPDDTITRAQLATLLVKALSLTPTAGSNPTFQDVPASYWGYQAVETAAAYGLVSGSNGSFYPDRPVTHQEMTVMQVNAAGLSGDAGQLSATDVDSLLALSDSGQISAWAAPYVAEAVKVGLVKGLGGAFNPLQPGTRAEAAILIDSLLNYQKTATS
jgi:hypothetical protein